MPTSAHLIAPTTIWTIGHSTRPLEEFLGLLAASNIEAVADVRSFPASRKFPHYGKEALAATLARRAIAYHWLPALGGRRPTVAGSPMQPGATPRFVPTPVEPANSGGEPSAYRSDVCGSSLVGCHRSMIADALCVRGIEVVHILDAKHSVVHPMTSPARIVRGELTYAAREPE